MAAAERSQVAQLVEHPAVNRRVVGSSPTRGAAPSPAPVRETVLLTGAAGDVATLVTPELRTDLRLRRLDVRPQKAEQDDEIVEADVRDVEALTAACRGVRAVIHLAAQREEADFRSLLLPQNLDGVWSAYEAAVRAHVPRFVFASTI